MRFLNRFLKNHAAVEMTAEGEKDVSAPWNSSLGGIGNAVGISDPGHSHGIMTSQHHQDWLTQQYYNAVNQGIGMNQAPQAQVSRKSGGFRTDIEPTEDGFIVTVHQLYDNGTHSGARKRFIAATIEEATQKIAAGIALYRLDDDAAK